MDYPLWTDRNGKETICKDDVSLPSGEDWYWKTAWTFAASKVDRDADGWQYATGWNSTSWKNQSRAIHFVRRRIWKRTRAIKPPGYVDSFNEANIDEILDEFELIPSNKPPGVIYIHPDDDNEKVSANNTKSQEASKEESKAEAEEILLSDLNDDSEDENGSPKRFISESSESTASLALDSSGCGMEIEFHTEDDEEEEEEAQFTAEDVARANELAQQELESDITESQVILEQERKEKERREREEAEFQRLEAERIERASQLHKQREEEQRTMEEEWKQREEEVRRQLEQDQKRLELLQQGSEIAPTTEEEPTPIQPAAPAPEPETQSKPTEQVQASNAFQFLVLDDEEDDEIFEIVTDSDDEIE